MPPEGGTTNEGGVTGRSGAGMTGVDATGAAGAGVVGMGTSGACGSGLCWPLPLAVAAISAEAGRAGSVTLTAPFEVGGADGLGCFGITKFAPQIGTVSVGFFSDRADSSC